MQSNDQEQTTRSLSNGSMRIEFLAKAGPRIVGLYVAGRPENLMAELPDLKVATPYGDYNFRGGHRLWYGPEEIPRTYMPDNEGLTISEKDGRVMLRQPTEPDTGIAKSIELELDQQRPVLTLHHVLKNDGRQAAELVPWAITQVRLGGVAIMPQQQGPLDKAGLLANRHLVLWPYTQWKDPRLELGTEFIAIAGTAKMPPCKIGYMNREGWLGYVLGDLFFVKRFRPLPDQAHGDFNCNAEIYCNDRFLELETLGPIVRLEPGQQVTHDETWEIYTGQEAQSALEKLGAGRFAGGGRSSR